MQKPRMKITHILRLERLEVVTRNIECLHRRPDQHTPPLRDLTQITPIRKPNRHIGYALRIEPIGASQESDGREGPFPWTRTRVIMAQHARILDELVLDVLMQASLRGPALEIDDRGDELLRERDVVDGRWRVDEDDTGDFEPDAHELLSRLEGNDAAE